MSPTVSSSTRVVCRTCLLSSNQVPSTMSATSEGVSASQNLRGVTARNWTGVARRFRRAVRSRTSIAAANRAPRVSVAEGVGRLIADPLPHRNGAAQLRVAQQVTLVQVPSVEADRADQVTTAGRGISTDEVLERWAALTAGARAVSPTTR